jgi:hypothetical protein
LIAAATLCAGLAWGADAPGVDTPGVDTPGVETPGVGTPSVETPAAAALGIAAPARVERARTSAFSDAEVTAALAAVKKDPNISSERTIRTLKWVDSDKKKQKKPDMSWLEWFASLFRWFTENGRYLFWGVLAVLAGLLLVYLWRLVRTLSLPERSRRFEAPSFVRDLDIRPESLPANIGAAARKLWDSGEPRSALSLLYRGLLSRLVHVHHVPIRDSSTEGDCVALANRHLAAEGRKIYVGNLVRIWQRAVYGGENIPTPSVYAICDEFASALDQPDVAPGAAPAGATA